MKEAFDRERTGMAGDPRSDQWRKFENLTVAQAELDVVAYILDDVCIADGELQTEVVQLYSRAKNLAHDMFEKRTRLAVNLKHESRGK